jgi:hypothetical protein
MAQQSGRICDTPIHHRIYLCASPLICILDMFSLPIQLISVSFSQNISFRTSLQLLLRRRFDDSSVKRPTYSKGPRWWLRWLFFIIGVLPQGIRLASFKNTPWTKIIGFIFLAHFLVGEVLILLASWIPIPTFAPFPKEDDKSKLRDWSYWVALSLVI